MFMSDEFKPGDVVALKSGGPRMTIKFIENGEASCTWFEGGKLSHASFGLEMIQTPPSIGTIPLSRS
jgi:uncharacterized protein YodC (DUF2158 family)